MEETGDSKLETENACGSQEGEREELGMADYEPGTRRSGAGGQLPTLRVRIKEGALAAVRDLFEKAIADPSSDAYRMIEIMCLNELVEAELKTREMDAVEIFKARNHGKEVEMKAERLQAQNKLAEAQTEKLQLQIRVLEDQIAQITQKALEASQAKKEGRQFDYDRALNQISALVGLRGPEEFRHDELEEQPN
jgi:hypothetical protein